jgi:hypothetical protein
MKITEYTLEIFTPGSLDDVWVTFSSPTPFMTISVGDIINPSVWEDSRSPMKVMRVVDVEHIIWETSGNAKHKIEIYTKEVDGGRGTWSQHPLNI